jgi:hypothetical protein
MGKWGFIYSSHLKKSRWGIFHRTSLVESSGVQLEPLESGLRPDKSGGALWSPVKSLCNPVDSPDKSGEAWKWKIWCDKHLDLSPNIFDASLLIVWLSYDSNKI